MNKKMKHWIEAAGVRAVRTMAQTAIAAIGTSVLLDDVDWIRLLSTVTMAGLLSVLTSLAGLPEVQRQNRQNRYLQILEICWRHPGHQWKM